MVLINWFLAVLSLHCCVWAFSSCGEQGLLLITVHGLLLLRSMRSRMRVQSLWHMGLVAPQHVESSLTRDQTHAPCISWQILNHWPTREVLGGFRIGCSSRREQFRLESCDQPQQLQ